jgi:hypothetical protein
MTQTISFKTTKEEFDVIAQIADRAIEVARAAGIQYAKQTALMDLTATHMNGCPLRLAELLNAPMFDFSHDVFGIRRHLNRETGKLENCFVPRFAAAR